MTPSSIRQSAFLLSILLSAFLGRAGLAEAQVVGDRVIPCDASCRRWLGVEARPVYREPPVYRARPSFRERAYLEDDGYYLEEYEPRMRFPRERREVWGPRRGFEQAPAREPFVQSQRRRPTVSSRPKSTISKSKKVADRKERLKDTGAIAAKVTPPPVVARTTSQEPVTPAPKVPAKIEAAPAAVLPQPETQADSVATLAEPASPPSIPAAAAPDVAVTRESSAASPATPAPPAPPVEVAAVPQQVEAPAPAPLTGISPPKNPLLDLTNRVTSEDDRKILQLLRGTAPDLALGDNDMGAGDNVAEDIPLTHLPDAVIARKPFFKDYQFFVSDGDAVLVTPKTRRVVKVYSSKDHAGAGTEASKTESSPSR